MEKLQESTRMPQMGNLLGVKTNQASCSSQSTKLEKHFILPCPVHFQSIRSSLMEYGVAMLNLITSTLTSGAARLSAAMRNMQ